MLVDRAVLLIAAFMFTDPDSFAALLVDAPMAADRVLCCAKLASTQLLLVKLGNGFVLRQIDRDRFVLGKWN